MTKKLQIYLDYDNDSELYPLKQVIRIKRLQTKCFSLEMMIDN